MTRIWSMISNIRYAKCHTQITCPHSQAPPTSCHIACTQLGEEPENTSWSQDSHIRFERPWHCDLLSHKHTHDAAENFVQSARHLLLQFPLIVFLNLVSVGEERKQIGCVSTWAPN